MLGSRLRTSDTTPTQPQYCPPSAPPNETAQESGVTVIFRNPSCFNMPETGLEPALVKPQPGPQPGASANSATPARSAIPYLMRMLPRKSSPNPPRLARKKVREAEGDFGLPDWVEGRG